MRTVLASRKRNLRRRTAAMMRFAAVAVMFLVLTGYSGGGSGGAGGGAIGAIGDGILMGMFACTAYVMDEIEQEKNKEKNKEIMAAEEQRLKETEGLISKAKNGDTNAQYELATRPDFSGIEEPIWLCGAADAGHARSRYILGVWYENGMDTGPINRDPIHAYKWYSLALKSVGGADYVGTSKERVAATLTPAQVVEAERLVAEWQPGQCEAEVKMDENAEGETAKSPAS